MPRRAKPRPAAERASGAARFGCGVDVVELPRLQQAMRRGGAAFMRKVFTPHEESYAKARRQTALLHLAGRFAAKEAVIKAVSQIDPGHPLTMKQVEVRNDRLGRPHVALLDGRARRLEVHVSLSHVKTVAVACAIAMR
jgi:holo-[acyl-carrier protein] synthase